MRGIPRNVPARFVLDFPLAFEVIVSSDAFPLSDGDTDRATGDDCLSEFDKLALSR
jgi:hypothetical protein